MENLVPFDENTLPFKVLADAARTAKGLIVEFQLLDPLHQVKLPTLASHSLRLNELWKETCFELFLSQPGETSYLEFNFSSQLNWNIYEFDSYRTPQPPKESNQAIIKNLNWDSTTLKLSVEIELSWLGPLSLSLTSVIRDQKDQITYLASHHAGFKPDFHLRDSFTLTRN